MGTWQSIPKVGPGDTIRSQYHNMIVDNLEWLKARVPSPFAIGSGYPGLDLAAGSRYLLMPFCPEASTGDPSQPIGPPLPFRARLSNLGISASRNDLDKDSTATLYVEGQPTALSVTVPATSAGVFWDSLHEAVAEAGARVYLVLDLTQASTGSLRLGGWAVRAAIEV